MPNFDRTGPTGKGPTGFGRGGCRDKSGATVPCPRGRGRGFGIAAQDMTLEEEEKMLEERLAAVRKAKAEKDA